MRFQHQLTYDATPEQVHAMLVDPAFRESVCDAQRVLSRSVVVEQDADGHTVVIDQAQPAHGVPSFARKFVGDQIDIVQREEWTSVEAARLHIEIPGKPGRLDGRVQLVATGGTTTQTVEGDIKVSLPLVGGKIEKLIADLLGKALAVEQRLGRDYLSA